MSKHLSSPPFQLGSAQLELLIEQQLRNPIGRPVSEFVNSTMFTTYVRVGPLCFVEGKREPALVLARVDIPEKFRGQRVFPALLETFEALALRFDFKYVMVECVHHEWLVTWLIRNGFEMHGLPNEGAPTLRKRVLATYTNS